MRRSLIHRPPALLAALAAALLGVVLLGCTTATPTAAPDATEPPAEQPDEPEPTLEGSPPAGAAEDYQLEGSSLTIENRTSVDICHVYIGQEGNPRLAEQLEEGEVIAPGESITFSGVDPLIYDMRIDNCEDETISSAYGLYLGVAPVTWAVEPLTDLTFENQSDRAVCAVHLSPIAATSWGPNLLADTTVEPGASATISPRPVGSYDLLVLPCELEEDEEGFEAYQVEVTEGFTYTFTGE